MPGPWGKDQIHCFLHHLYSDCLLDGVELKDCAAGCNLDVCDGGVNDGLPTVPGILVIRSLCAWHGSSQHSEHQEAVNGS